MQRPDHLLLPALVNAHTHLDLTAIGPQPLAGRSFVEWVDMIRDQRPANDRATIQALWQGIDKTLAGGTGIIGDIAGIGSHAAVETLAHRCLGPEADSDIGYRVGGTLRGVSFLEIFGQRDSDQTAAIDRLPGMIEQARNQLAVLKVDHDRFRVGIQPHAPYSAGLRVYEAVARLAREQGLPVSTHLSETREEEQFTRCADGPFVELLTRLGKWDDTITATGLHPIDHLAPVLLKQKEKGSGVVSGDNDAHPHVPAQRGWLCAHVNYLEHPEVKHLNLLRKAGVTVAYCPRASTYFGHKGHPYRAMLAAGVRVALGTDSIVCLDTPDRISVWDDMRFLSQRDGMDPDVLLAMATVNGALSLGFDPQLVTLQAGPSAGVIAVPAETAGDPLTSALSLDTDTSTLERLI
ncbi:MAG: amidohydrolase family protein [Planctomycetes bacterium]|nr:amidohydrolase family protein [Planctomycetota bacterium]